MSPVSPGTLTIKYFKVIGKIFLTFKNNYVILKELFY